MPMTAFQVVLHTVVGWALYAAIILIVPFYGLGWILDTVFTPIHECALSVVGMGVLLSNF